MQSPTIDFGIFISIVLPGFVIVAGLAQLNPVLRAVMRRSHRSTSDKAGAALLFSLLSMLAGMCLGAVRASVWVPRDIDYSMLANDSVRASFLLAHEQRRFHQFYGNMFIAVPVAGICYLLRHRRSLKKKKLCLAALVTLGLVLTGCLGVGASRTLNRFYRALETLNALCDESAPDAHWYARWVGSADQKCVHTSKVEPSK